MDRMRAFYADKGGLRPDRKSPVRLSTEPGAEPEAEPDASPNEPSGP